MSNRTTSVDSGTRTERKKEWSLRLESNQDGTGSNTKKNWKDVWRRQEKVANRLEEARERRTFCLAMINCRGIE